MVKIMENPIKMDGLGGFPIIFGGPPIWEKYKKSDPQPSSKMLTNKLKVGNPRFLVFFSTKSMLQETNLSHRSKRKKEKTTKSPSTC